MNETREAVLVLEDEPIIALDLEELLIEAGLPNVATFSSIADAEVWLETNTPKIAIVDPRLRDGFCTVIVETLIERKVPFIVYSGDRQTVEDHHESFLAGAWILKPAEPDVILAAVRASVAITDASNMRLFR